MTDTPTTPEAALAEALAPRPWIDEPHELAEETLALLRASGWDVVQGWRTMDPPPPQGEIVLVWVPGDGEATTAVRTYGGWVYTVCGQNGYDDHPSIQTPDVDPTHWRPLPPAPAAAP